MTHSPENYDGYSNNNVPQLLNQPINQSSNHLNNHSNQINSQPINHQATNQQPINNCQSINTNNNSYYLSVNSMYQKQQIKEEPHLLTTVHPMQLPVVNHLQANPQQPIYAYEQQMNNVQPNTTNQQQQQLNTTQFNAQFNVQAHEQYTDDYQVISQLDELNNNNLASLPQNCSFLNETQCNQQQNSLPIIYTSPIKLEQNDHLYQMNSIPLVGLQNQLENSINFNSQQQTHLVNNQLNNNQINEQKYKSQIYPYKRLLLVQLNLDVVAKLVDLKR